MKKEEIQKALQPIAEGLFGKQGAGRYERPHFELRPLAAMLRDLIAVPPEEWYRYAFSREPLNGRLKDEQRQEWMKRAIAFGREYAEKICRCYDSRDSETIAKAMGMQVMYPAFPEKTDRVLFAEFREPNNISIYMDAVKRAKKLTDRPEIASLLTEKLNISRILLAHELFHSVEESCKQEIFTKTEKIRLWSLGPLHNDSTLIALSEIAAMSFAAQMTGLPYSPYMLDMFLVYGYSPEEACGLYEEMMTCAGRPFCRTENE